MIYYRKWGLFLRKRNLFILLLTAIFLFGCQNQSFIDQDDVCKEDLNIQNSIQQEIVNNNSIDYSKMSKVEIISEFLNAWQADNIEVMDELSDFPEDFVKNKYFEGNGYHALFSWGNVSIGEGFGVGPTCSHGYENFSHTLYNIKIRQSNNSDYGCAPDELKTLYPNYENVYTVNFEMDENSIIRHLEVCIYGWKEGSLHSDDIFARDGVYADAVIWVMFFDQEKGHWVIKEQPNAF